MLSCGRAARYIKRNYLFKYLSDVPINAPVNCWNCKTPSTNLFCPNCKVLQKPRKEQNYFQIIDLQETYDVKESELSQNFKALQKQLHPDKFSNRSKNEQSISDEYSSLVNKAYSTLLQPLSRGIYLLQLRGIEIEDKTQLESEFLHEIMELNEAIENADAPQEILDIEEKNDERIAKLQCDLSYSFKNNDLLSAKKIIMQIKYYESARNQIKEIIRKMNIIK